MRSNHTLSTGFLLGCPLLALAIAIVLHAEEQKTEKMQKAEETEKVSYYQQVRPLFQAHCQECHQPAKAQGEYVMTSFAQLLKGGESEEAAIVPGQPAESRLLEMILPEKGEAEMPEGKPPLNPAQIEIIKT